MKKILFVIDSLGSGGAEKSLVNLLSLIDYKKYRVDLAVFGQGGINEKFLPKEVRLLPVIKPHTNGGRFGRLGIKIAKLCFSFSLRIRKIKTANDQAIRYWKFFKKNLLELNESYDVAFAYAQRLPTMFTAKKVRAKRKFAWINVTIHHDELLRKFYLNFFNDFNKIICVSKDVQVTVDESYPELQHKTSVIYDIINPKFIRVLSQAYRPFTTSDNVINILTVARLNFEQKGYDILIEVCKILKKKGYKFIWRALGNGEKEREISNLISKYHLNNYFHLCGIRPNPYPYFAHSDIYVQTFRYEGYGLAIAEARLLGVPVITTPYDCVNLQIQNGKNGIISTFEPYDIAMSIARLIDDRELYNSIKCNLEKENIGNLTEFSKIEKLLEYED